MDTDGSGERARGCADWGNTCLWVGTGADLLMPCANTPSLPLEDAEGGGGEEYPIDIWLLLASYIRPEDIVRFSLICKKAWTVTCTAAFWTRLYRR